MFKTLVITLDLEADGDRALPIVHLLSRCGPVQVELVTVSEPGVRPQSTPTSSSNERSSTAGTLTLGPLSAPSTSPAGSSSTLAVVRTPCW